MYIQCFKVRQDFLVFMFESTLVTWISRLFPVLYFLCHLLFKMNTGGVSAVLHTRTCLLLLIRWQGRPSVTFSIANVWSVSSFGTQHHHVQLYKLASQQGCRV